MISKFGKFTRKLRITNNETMILMAYRLGVTSSYLSAIELGKRSIPADWPKKITEIYSLNEEQSDELCKVINNSPRHINIQLSNYTDEDKELLLLFKEQFMHLSDRDKRNIKEILAKV